MGRRSWLVDTARLLQRLPLGWARPLEAPFVRTGATGRPHLMFLLALPRSGSTLTYQTLVHGLKPLYLSNLWNLLYGLPWVGGRISRSRCASHESNFRSSHGFVEGLCGPAEGLRFWSWWTGCGLDETAPPPVSEVRLARRVGYFRDVVSSLATPATPMVAGYLGHVLITEQLRAWFPEAIFLRLHRDPLSNAASILRSRGQGSGDWFSVRPRECRTIEGHGVHAEVAAQVYWLNRRLEWLNQDDRTLHVSYEQLGRDPAGVLEHIIEGANARGLALSARRALPSSFDYRMVSPDDDVDASLLWSELQQLESVHGPLEREAGSF